MTGEALPQITGLRRGFCRNWMFFLVFVMFNDWFRLIWLEYDWDIIYIPKQELDDFELAQMFAGNDWSILANMATMA